jgi:hypothetical protein
MTASVVWRSELTVGIRHADYVVPSIRKKLALTSLTSGGRGIVRLRTKATGFPGLTFPILGPLQTHLSV